jgi:signal transduction histidine kinase
MPIEPEKSAASSTGARDASRRERHFLHRMEAVFARRSPAFVLVVGVLLVALTFTVDVLTGPFLSPSLFYVVPVALVTWRLGRRPGIGVAALGAAAWLVADLMGGQYPAESLVPYWNLAVRFGVLSIVAALIATARDTLQWQTRLAMREAEAAEELREMNDLKNTLLHAISHDLRGPITAVIGAAQALRRKEQLQLTPEEEESLLEAIGQSGKKLNRMVTDLLDLERLDRGIVKPECEPVDLAVLVGRVVAEADFLSQHPVRTDAEPVVVSVDGGKVERIVDNLLSNAAKHTPVGTPILVRVESVDHGALLSVEDEGPGIPDSMKETIFQPFRQGEVARANGAGAGIGLSLVARFAELHGGRAWAEDRPGGGTIFRVLLPSASALTELARGAEPARVTEPASAVR